MGRLTHLWGASFFREEKKEKLIGYMWENAINWAFIAWKDHIAIKKEKQFY